jgi:D-glycero-alpha-D-manno-heptose-7-phosphate kinase
MIITQTPLRISFAGGGTDFPDYYQEKGGAVLSSAIDKYIYVIVKQRFDRKIRMGYTQTEMVDSVDELQHELAREALRKVGIEHGVEIATMADIPSEGSGLGSSSAVTVGLYMHSTPFVGNSSRPSASLRRLARLR